MTDRQLRVLEVLAEAERPLSAGRIWSIGFSKREPFLPRRDAGMTRTLDAMAKHDLVTGHWTGWKEGGVGSGREWEITDHGREVLAENRRS